MRSPFAVLDFPVSPGRPGGGTLLFDRPLRVLEAASLDDVLPTLHEVDAEVRRGRHAVGFVAYEAGPAFDRALAARRGGAVPLAWFGIFAAPSLQTTAPTTLAADAAHAVTAWQERTDSAAYAHAVEAIRDAIGRGDVYQVNYTVRLDVELGGDTQAVYRRLLHAQGPGYGAHIHTGRHEILSASPELFFDRRGASITTKPMKGTARRGRWIEEDDAHAAALAASAKERAENVMIVDLVRNDLGHIANVGSVRASRLFDVERRPTVLQMTSTIEAELRADVCTADIFEALFPCGSVTGAPKIAASQIIATLEGTARGVYCGAIGHIAPGGDATFSVAIRTLTLDPSSGRAEYGVGSGITWDSARDAEYDEVVSKAGILTADLPQFELIETLRLERGAYVRLDGHLARLSASAAYFGFDPPHRLREAALHALAAHARSSPAQPPQRVRLSVSADGVASISARALTPADGAPITYALAATPVRRANRFLCHKTTHRAVYDRHRAEHPGLDDVLLWNEDDELTEFTIGNVVIEIDGVRYTPPRESGLLAGVFRAELLEEGAVHERVLTRDDLARASHVWLINSVREWVEARPESAARRAV